MPSLTESFCHGHTNGNEVFYIGDDQPDLKINGTQLCKTGLFKTSSLIPMSDSPVQGASLEQFSLLTIGSCNLPEVFQQAFMRGVTQYNIVDTDDRVITPHGI